MKKQRLQKGFTLIELMIVVAVIGVLAAIAVPQYQNYIAKGEASSALASLTGHRTNVETYVLDYGTFPASGSLALPTVALGSMSYIAGTSAGQGTLSLEFKKPGTSPLVAGKAINLVRDAAGSWSCAASGIPSNIAPKGC
uniref:pilin n=1 Tax=Thaumasiovibrio occultus TaxID=1891184 RepID=UPI000B3593BE|nr:pilin [Thaumasiovibrio occultus]